MSNEPLSTESGDDDLANQRPVPIEQADGPISVGTSCTIFAAVAFVAYALIGNSETAARGATRSSTLRWQQQQLEMRQAECEVNRAAETSVESPNALLFEEHKHGIE